MEVLEEEETCREVVVMLIYNQRGEVLFTKRSLSRKFLPGVWALPSGHINIGQENFREATIREGKEELNIDVSNVCLHEIIDESDGNSALVYLVDIPADAYTGDPVINTDEFDSIAWMNIGDFFRKFRDEEIGSTLQHLRSKYKGHKKQNQP